MPPSGTRTRAAALASRAVLAPLIAVVVFLLLGPPGFLLGQVTAQGAVPEELLQSRFFVDTLVQFPFDELESAGVARSQSSIQHDLHGEAVQIDVPGFDQRIQEEGTVLDRHGQHVRIQELEDEDTHLLEAAPGAFRDQLEPAFIRQLLLGRALDGVQELLPGNVPGEERRVLVGAQVGLHAHGADGQEHGLQVGGDQVVGVERCRLGGKPQGVLLHLIVAISQPGGQGVIGNGLARLHADAPGREQPLGNGSRGSHAWIVHQREWIGEDDQVAAAQHVLVHGKGQRDRNECE